MTPTEHEREALRHFRLARAHTEIADIASEIERLQHRREMLETYIAGDGEGEPPEP
jgi:ubiquinone biosynthesis protein UbiJ